MQISKQNHEASVFLKNQLTVERERDRERGMEPTDLKKP